MKAVHDVVTLQMDRRGAEDGPLHRQFEGLRDRGRQEVNGGNLGAALLLLDEALAVAKRIGDPELIDLAFCNRSPVALALGRNDGVVPELREILMRNRDGEICFAAAYGLSQAYEIQKSFKKALFYGQIARDRAVGSGKNELIAKAHNQIGLCLVAESYFQEAIHEYQRALELLPEELSLVRVSILASLAYPKAVLGQYSESFELLFSALRWYRQNGTVIYEPWLHLMLCYAYSETGRFRYAWKHGRKALAMAEATGDQDAVKNALFLLGEIDKAVGDFDSAFQYYARIQRDFCPEVANLPAMMLVVETKQLVNLGA